MSRIGRTPITIPENVTVVVGNGAVVIKGPKGELITSIAKKISVMVKDGKILVSKSGDTIQARANHGLVRSLINNNVKGVTEGYKKTLKLVGTGYRANTKGTSIELAVGFSHKVEVKPITGIKITLEGNDTIHIEGIDKQKVGQQAAQIRLIKPPEPYKGKGIRYSDEVVNKKQGKTAA